MKTESHDIPYIIPGLSSFILLPHLKQEFPQEGINNKRYV
jgi:hypothetical protein